MVIGAGTSMNRYKGLSIVGVIVVLVGVLALVFLGVYLTRVFRSDGHLQEIARIHTLENGVWAYYESNNRAFLPGQQFPKQLRGDGGPLTGSQLLAQTLFTPKDGTYPADFGKDGSLLAYSPDRLMSYHDLEHTLADQNTDPMPILYYVARVRQEGVDQFKEADNSPYTDQARGNSATFKDFITAPGKKGGVVNDGKFILIAPGRDRKYFTDDDTVNFVK
jgi:hypothetical protein